MEMTVDRASLVYVEKDGELKIHRAKAGEVHWDNGRTTQEEVPACGTRVDVTALYSYEGALTEVTCGRCQRKS